jgi:erythromycin esterase-like protein
MVTRHDFGRTKATGTAEPDLVKRLSGLSSPLTEERDLDPLIERLGNYVPTDLARRYDAMLYIDQTTAVLAHRRGHQGEPPDTYPFNV